MANLFSAKPTLGLPESPGQKIGETGQDNHDDSAEQAGLDSTPVFTIPTLTFGVEQEFNFAVAKSKFKAFDDVATPIIFETAENASTSHNTGSEKRSFLVAHLRYVFQLLTHQNPALPTYNIPSVLGEVQVGAPKGHPYDRFTLTLDDSVMPKWRAQVKALEGVDAVVAEESQAEWDKAEKMLKDKTHNPANTLKQFFGHIEQDFDRVGLELVSKVFKFDDQEHWLECFQQIESDLKWDAEYQHGAFVDVDPHLHVHMTTAEGPPLRTVQNIIILYGLFESEIERWHPASQRDNKFCWSLRKGTDLQPWTPNSFAKAIYATKTLNELKQLVVDREHAKKSAKGIDTRNYYHWVHVNISPPRGKNKPTTLEFRQHRGTLDTEEIKWWTLFCGYLFHYAHLLTEQNIIMGNTQEPGEENGKLDFLFSFSKESILTHIGFPEEGIKFFEAKAIEYLDAHSERRNVLRGKITDARIELRSAGHIRGQVDKIIRTTQWYKAANEEFCKELNADVKEQRTEREKRRRRREFSERESERVARGAARRKVKEALAFASHQQKLVKELLNDTPREVR